MQEKLLLPHAASLSQSMRDLGYSLETAIADLIDNSITAGSENINIFVELGPEAAPCLVIVDDGCGMIEDELFEAMRPGSRDPREKRDPDDLGRFGLGLKTASFSQCRSLTVVSRKNGALSSAIWDLDTLTERNEWVVHLPTQEKIESFPYIDQLGKNGTYILWQKMDRLLAGVSNEQERSNAYNKLDLVERHLALVFHRYLIGDYKNRKCSIHINRHPVASFDPFCLSNKATQILPEEIVRIDNEEIKIQPYILPHHSKLTQNEYNFYRTRSDFVSNQGAYIYRNGRLMAWGDWFRLVPKSEATKLARVRIDFPNALDEHWTIDIKKSRAHPPYPVRDKLRNIIKRITDQSVKVHTGLGSRILVKAEFPLWIRFSERNSIRYVLNRDHPIITSILNNIPEDCRKSLENLYSVIEQEIPVEAIYADYSSSPQSFEESEEIPREDLKEKLKNLHILMSVSGAISKENFIRIVSDLKPFSDNRIATQEIIEELTQ